MTKRGAQSPCCALLEIRELVQIIVVKQHADASLPSASVVALPTTTPLAVLSDEVLLPSLDSANTAELDSLHAAAFQT